MHALHRIRNNPIVVLCVAWPLHYFIWIAMDLLPSGTPTPTETAAPTHKIREVPPTTA